MDCNYCLNYVCVVFNIMFISNCFASNVFESAPIEGNQGFILNSVHKRSLLNNETDAQSTTPRSSKKWQVGRVSRKHYEIINMLWRRTKVFMDVETITQANQFQNNCATNYKRHDHTKHAETPFKSQSMKVNEKVTTSSSTPSFIEFYYFDENYETAKVEDRNIDDINFFSSEAKTIKSGNVFTDARKKFRSNDPNSNPTALTFNNIVKKKVERRNQRSFSFDSSVKSHNASFDNLLKSVKLREILGNRTLVGQTLRTVNIYLNSSYKATTKNMSIEQTNIESTTVYDKVKFFEMYDKHTTLYATEDDHYNHYDKLVPTKDVLDHEKIDSMKVNQNIEHNDNKKSRLKRKHITKLPPTPTNIDNISANTTYEFRDNSALEELVKQTRHSSVANTSRLAYWSYYPFVAVYVYEPTQTHCDAAGISPHWLIAAGACLSRHHVVHSVDARSAFVTYCGESWRQPQRIAYVKYSLVHPKFNPRNKATKHNYNIGLIQVSSSMMSSCKGWAPVTLMSYQFTARPEGTLVSALGWGLDRYGTKYMSKKLPHWPLTVYNGLVYSDSCPGSPAYSKAQRDSQNGNNVFCLLLPPYLGEETDPVHGGLLIDSGKLIALYLQEERRSSGPQSAQYTGVWRLFPWVLDVAREPEDVDSFPLDL